MKSLVDPREGKFQITNEQLSHSRMAKLEAEHGSSFYLFNVEKLRENYNKINHAFQSRYSKFIIGYSYKTNYLPYLCKELSKLGAFAEVVSRLEYDLAIKIGVAPNKIIFNGPLKTEEDIFYALNNDSLINIDSYYEIEFVKKYCTSNPQKQVKIGLRLNFDLSENGVSPLVEGYELSRFGICVENGNLNDLINELKNIDNLKIVGLHGHFSTSRRKISSYSLITKTLCDIAKEYSLDVEYIDIGGGIFGEVPKSLIDHAPTFDEYAEAVCSIMNEEFPNHNEQPALILEPGIAMVANTFSFVAKVVGVKTIRDIHFVLVDGSVHNIKPTMHLKNLPMKFIRKNDEGEKEQKKFNIVGYTCLEKDYLARDLDEVMPEINDYITFENVGAYTLVFNPQFIKERPAIIAEDHNKRFVVRKKETIKQFFNEELYCF